jgi:hypothetical protein
LIAREADLTSGTVQRLDNLNAKLDELLEWYKAVNFGAVKQALLDALPDTQKRVVYQLSTDGRPGEEFSKLIDKLGIERIAGRTINRWQAEWVRLGLLRQAGRKRERIFSLSDFGIEIGVDFNKLNSKPSEDEEG